MKINCSPQIQCGVLPDLCYRNIEKLEKTTVMKTTKTNYDKLNSDIRIRRNKVNQAENFFREAIVKINRNETETARELAEEALFHARTHSPKLLTDCHGLLATIHIDLENYDMARIHCWEALELLNPNDYKFREDFDYFKALQRRIDKLAKKKLQNMPGRKVA